ncbi:MAG TPA: glycosyltransferase family 87 protein [Patescibacteria group bacterium]|nr:glycosyltransferase family 87 protein [Patescibacteria group bacterium]
MNPPAIVNTSRFRPFIYAAIAYLLILQIGALALNVPRGLTGDGDLPSFYRAGLMVRSGQGRNLYNVGAQIRYEHLFLPHRDRPIQIYYHPPFEALPLVLLTQLSYKDAFWVWSAAGVGALLLGARALAPELQNLSVAAGAPIWLIFLCFFPVANTILQGQDSLFLFVLLAFAYREFRSKRELRAGVLLGLALFKFQYIAPLVFILAFLRWRPRLLFSCGVTALFLAGISWAQMGTSGLLAYWHLLGHHYVEQNRQMPDLRGLVLTLGGNRAIVIGLSLAVAVWCGLRKAPSLPAEFSAALVAAALVSYHMHIYDMSILLIPLAVTLDAILKDQAWKRLLLPGLFWITPLYGLLLHTNLYVLLSLPLLGLLYAIPIWLSANAASTASVPVLSK